MQQSDRQDEQDPPRQSDRAGEVDPPQQSDRQDEQDPPPQPDEGGEAKAHPSRLSGPLRAGDPVVVLDRRGRRNLFFLAPGERIHTTVGYVEGDALIGQSSGLVAHTSKGHKVDVFRPTLEEYVQLMPRAAQIISAKDMAFIVSWADVFGGATVVEAGLGSAALTLGLLRAVGPAGKVIAYEVREPFANRGRKNVAAWPEPFLERLEIRAADVHVSLPELTDIDRVVLDLPDPWNAVPGAARALRPGGILLAYLPTIRQVDQLVMRILDQRELAAPEVVETLVRPWVADRVRLRPAQRIVGHTGFLVRSRRAAKAREPDETNESAGAGERDDFSEPGRGRNDPAIPPGGQAGQPQ